MKDQKAIFYFLLKFIGIYIVLNTLYGLWISSYGRSPDPFTRIVTIHTTGIIAIFEDKISVIDDTIAPNVLIKQDERAIVSVFEGCNSINVMIVFISFIVAFTGSLKKTALFGIAGFVLIYIVNLLRVGLLFYIAKYYPNNLYFFHKYLFTGLLYVLVFFLWYYWVKKIWPRTT